MDTTFLAGVSNEFYAGWGTLALINCVLAQGKNRSGLLWLVLSLFIGPFVTLILAFLSKPSHK
ncbi:hypothetical protein OS175_11060 [Marinicella sp. S1101]|uniref:hypothetical protein n=1 Tax=Marinicella marina TaxID=2996016 RepID=UPI00226088A5|nr:hypothetical protein [Marinicella marina]MCX7554422.1 hypothetical protein [Marinicella marina]MDJ1140573.1 hypothetical protein [Marinicella marina]